MITQQGRQGKRSTHPYWKLMRAVARSTLARTSRAMAEASSLAASAAARELATQ